MFVGRLDKDVNKITLRNQFCKFGPVLEVRQRARDAWSAVEAANSFPQYDVGFGGRRAFCRQSYADLGEYINKYVLFQMV